MSRFARTVFIATFVPLSAPIFALAGAEADAKRDRPNFLWLVSEDASPWLGAYGDRLARTPHLDRLAREGVRYTQVHAAGPVCAASRASLISGVYAPQLGTQHMRSRVPLPDGWRYYPSYLREAGYYCTNNAKTDYNAETPSGTWDASSAQAHWSGRRPGQPFFAIFNSMLSHESGVRERRPLTTDPASVRVPPYLPDTPTVRSDLAQAYDRMAAMDRQLGEKLAELAASDLADDTIVFYYSDHGGVLPRSKRFLYDNGTRVPLIVRFPPKYAHLAPAAPGTVIDEIVSLVDLPPTLCSLAGIPVPPQFRGRALAGPERRAPPRFVHAFRDRMDERYDLSRAVIGGRWRYIRNYRPELPAGQRIQYLWGIASMQEWERLHRAGALTPTQAAFFRARAPEELYDVQSDPDNVYNRAGEPASRDVLLAMRAANREHLLATGDLGFMPEAMIRARAGKRSPTFLARDDAEYPLARLLDLIDRLQLAPEPDVTLVREALVDPVAAVRYWGIVGTAKSPLPAPRFQFLLDDPAPSVRVAAAARILREADDERAWRVLAQALRAVELWPLQLEAANVVSLVPRSWPSWLEPALAIGATKREQGPYVSWLCSYLLTGDDGFEPPRAP